MDHMDIPNKDRELLLSPSEMKRKTSPRPFMNLFHKKYLLFLLVCVSMGFYLSYTSPLTWKLKDVKGLKKVSGNNTYDKIGITRKLTTKSVIETNEEYTDYDSYGNTQYKGWTSTERMDYTTTMPEALASVEAQSCHIPELNPFDASIQRYIHEKPEPAECEKDHPKLFTTDLESNLIQFKNPLDFGYTFCCYQKFSRVVGGNDAKVEFGKNCVPITEPVTPIPRTIDFIMVSCVKNRTIKPVDFFGFVHLKPEVEGKFAIPKIPEEDPSAFNKSFDELEEKPWSGKNEENRKVNVVILGLDALSHMNFMRTMPLTYEYLTKNLSALGLFGYTKVGDNTFPNLVPVLTGLTVEEIQKTCWRKKSQPFDKCPFIWKNYAAQGYRTAYGEDAVWMGIFNYQKRGFTKDPTDYYNNPLTFQLEERVGHHKLLNAKLCYGPRIGFDVSLDFLKKMAHTMGKTRRYFQFIWATSMFHDYLNEGKLGDPPLLETLKWFKDGGHLENTILILMSDHGIRWGGIRSTLQGRLEERMPFLYFVFPDWFKEQYRPAVSNLIRNKNRLTTPFDLHETLRDLLILGSLKDVKQRYDYVNDLPRGISLFLPVPKGRTCQDAGIEEHWCVCRTIKSVPVQNTSLVEEAAQSVVHHLNGMFLRFPQCLSLYLKQVLNAQVFQSSNEIVKDDSAMIVDANDPRLAKQDVTFTIAIEVAPSGATFEATTTRRTNGLWQVSGDVSRTNVYGDQSWCVSDYNLKKFCFCG